MKVICVRVGALLLFVVLAASCSTYRSQLSLDRSVSTLTTKDLWKELEFWYVEIRELELHEPPQGNSADAPTHGVWGDKLGADVEIADQILSELQKRRYSAVSTKQNIQRIIRQHGLTKIQHLQDRMTMLNESNLDSTEQ